MTKEIVGQLDPIFKASSIAVIVAANTPPGHRKCQALLPCQSRTERI